MTPPFAVSFHPFSGGRERAVSYTHLDVYKRQDACRPGNPKDTSVEDLKELFRKIME